MTNRRFIVGLVFPALAILSLVILQVSCAASPDRGREAAAAATIAAAKATEAAAEATKAAARYRIDLIPTVALSPAPSDLPIATLPPPLADVEFQMEVADYLPDWPAELRYPEQFRLVDSNSGVLPGGRRVWNTKLLYTGESKSAVSLLSSFFRTREWQIAERIDLDSGGTTLFVERDGKRNTGVIVIDIDPNDPNRVRILLTIFL